MMNKSCNRTSFFWPCGCLHFYDGTLFSVIVDREHHFLGWRLLVAPPNLLCLMDWMLEVVLFIDLCCLYLVVILLLAFTGFLSLSDIILSSWFSNESK